VVDTRARAAKDRPRLTVEAGPGPGHERDAAGESLRLCDPWLVGTRTDGLEKMIVVVAFGPATCNTVGSDQSYRPRSAADSELGPLVSIGPIDALPIR
jgi:hypothetical protein